MATNDIATHSTELAAAWAAMTKPQRMAFLRQSAALNTTSAERMKAVEALKRRAGGA